MQTKTHTLANIHTHTFAKMRTHTHSQTCMNTHTHTHTHTHTQRAYTVTASYHRAHTVGTGADRASWLAQCRANIGQSVWVRGHVGASCRLRTQTHARNTDTQPLPTPHPFLSFPLHTHTRRGSCSKQAKQSVLLASRVPRPSRLLLVAVVVMVVVVAAVGRACGCCGW